MAYRTGNREQMMLLPQSIEDYVGQGDPVRAFDAFVEALDFNKCGIIIDSKKDIKRHISPLDTIRSSRKNTVI